MNIPCPHWVTSPVKSIIGLIKYCIQWFLTRSCNNIFSLSRTCSFWQWLLVETQNGGKWILFWFLVHFSVSAFMPSWSYLLTITSWMESLSIWSLAGVVLNSAVIMAVRLITQRVWHTFNYDVTVSNGVNLCQRCELMPSPHMKVVHYKAAAERTQTS